MSMMSYTTIRGRTPLVGYVDNESLRIGVQHGYSKQMSGDLRGVAGPSFQLLQATQVVPRHLPGVDNPSDALIKTLPRTTLIWRTYFGLEVSGIPKKPKVRAQFVHLRIYEVMRKAGAAFVVRERKKSQGVMN